MKWLFSILMFLSLTTRSQDRISGDWYHISTGRLVQMSIRADVVWWSECTFQFQNKGGKLNAGDLITVLWNSDVAGIVSKSKDSADTLPYGLTVLQQNKDLRFFNVLMECSDGSYKDTINMHNNFAACNSSGKMQMRFYSKASIDSFKTFKPVTGITKRDLDRINGLFKKKTDQLVSEFGEDKLLWIAPIIFQQALTDLLLENGYNPMLTEEQAEKLFDFNFF